MTDQFIGEIRIFSFTFAPKGWVLCNGQLLSIQLNQALFSLLGTTFGGNGSTTFGVPNLQGRVPIHSGSGFTLGQQGGEQTHTLNLSEMAAHSHAPQASTVTANQLTPAGNIWGNGNQAAYSGAAPTISMDPSTVGSIGGGQAHDNMSPYLVLNICIATQGIFPTRT